MSSAEVLSPLSQRILELIASSSHVNADETSLKVQATGECRRAFVWDFIATNDNHTMVAYLFSADRSGQTPIKVLGDSTGVLQVDGFTGYNQVTTPDKRERAGCWAHARRKYFGALDSAPDEAQWAIDKIREIYEVEYLAAEKKVLGRPQHLTLRKAKSKGLV
ncbi:transposase [Microvenator marinus]|uniref:Transposase n=1 Tax=Microvenator marinus TaxID=2600177 RepID=A0A5B8XWM2_9DELT|nr:transposase [Microvenator marinus]